MARIFSYINHSISPTMAYVLVIIGVMSETSVVVFLCSSREREKHRQGEGWGRPSLGKRLSWLSNGVSCKALLVVRMVTWRKVAAERDEDGGEDSDEEALWRKTIVQGEKCRPLDFSGQIVYDSVGKTLARKDVGTSLL